MSVNIFLFGIALLMILVMLLVYRKKSVVERSVQASEELLPQVGRVDRAAFDKQLADRAAGGRFARRECTLLRFCFQTDDTGVGGAIVDLLVESLQTWSIPQEFYISIVDEGSFVVLVEGVSLPDESSELADLLCMHLDLPIGGGGEHDALEFALEHGSFPFDTDDITQLWAVVENRLSQRKSASAKRVLQSSVQVRDDGILVIDLGQVESIVYESVASAFQVYLDEYAPLYPGVKLPQLCKAGRVLKLSAGAMGFTRSKTVVDAISAAAVAPNRSITKHLMRMYIYYNQPPYPFKVCSSEEEAVEWLKNYVDPKFFMLHAKASQRSAA